MDRVAGSFDGKVHLSPGTFDSLLSLVTKTLGLLLQIITCILKIVTSVCDASAKLLASSDSRLWSVEKGYGRTRTNTDAKSKPIILCAHIEKHLVLDFLTC
jgi:hypothetical protein